MQSIYSNQSNSYKYELLPLLELLDFNRNLAKKYLARELLNNFIHKREQVI